MEQDQSTIELNTMKTKILHEIPYIIDIKPFSHNIISLELRLIAWDVEYAPAT